MNQHNCSVHNYHHRHTPCVQEEKKAMDFLIDCRQKAVPGPVPWLWQGVYSNTVYPLAFVKALWSRSRNFECTRQELGCVQ